MGKYSLQPTYISWELIHILHIFNGAARLNMLAIVLENLIQQFRVSKPGGLLLSCKDDQQHQNISAMPGRQRAFGSVLRIDPQ